MAPALRRLHGNYQEAGQGKIRGSTLSGEPRNAAGELAVRLGVRVLDEHLEFLAGRCRPDTVLAVAYDLKVFFTVVKNTPHRVRPVDVLAFMTVQRAGGDGRLQVAGAGAGGGVSPDTAAAVQRVRALWVPAGPRGRERLG